jgi:hypothetical protein
VVDVVVEFVVEVVEVAFENCGKLWSSSANKKLTKINEKMIVKIMGNIDLGNLLFINNNFTTKL